MLACSEVKKKQMVVVCDLDGNLNYNLQLISKADALGKDFGKTVIVIDFCMRAEEYCVEYEKYGASTVILFDKNNMDIMSIKDSCYEIINEIEPYSLFFGAHGKNRVLASFISVLTESGLVAECIEIEKREEDLVFTRAAVNDSIIADIKCVQSKINIGTIKKDIFSIQENTGHNDVHILKLKYSGEERQSKIQFLRNYILEKSKSEIRLDQKVIIGVGRGGYSSLNKIKQLSDMLHTGVAVTRPLVEKYAVPYEMQIGQSGKSVQPQVYLALGISGASQHLVGIKNAKTIIAVNKDENAPIAKFADYFICEDIEKVVEEMLNELEV